MKKKILITGISSLLMRELTPLIDSSKYKTFGLTRNKNLVPIENVSLIYGDLSDLTSFESTFRKIDIIIHAAAITHSFKPYKYFESNLEFTKKLIDSAVKNSVEKFIFISSNTAGETCGAYGKSKLLAEDYLKEHFTNWLIFRPAEIFGGIKSEGIDKLITDALTKKVFISPKSVSTKFYPIHIDDAIRTIYSNSFEQVVSEKTIRINGDVGYSFKEIILMTANILNKKIFILQIPKFVMFTIMYVSKIIPIFLGVIPDQILRLYCNKKVDLQNNKYLKLEEYIISLTKNNIK